MTEIADRGHPGVIVAIVCTKTDLRPDLLSPHPWLREREIVYAYLNPNQSIPGRLWVSLPRELIVKILSMIPGRRFNQKQMELIENVRLDEIQEYCRQVGKPLFFTSAKDNTGIEEMFLETGRMVLDQIKQRDLSQRVE